MRPRILFLGLTDGTHVCGSWLRAAEAMGVDAAFVSLDLAASRSSWSRRFHWHALDRRYPNARRFRAALHATVESFRPTLLLATGAVPLHSEDLAAVRRSGVTSAVFLTDDPFNRRNTGRWFLESLRHFDLVLNPRTECERDLARLGCRRVERLMFGYDPELFSPVEPDREQTIDLSFIGNGDSDRAKIIQALMATGHRVAVYGSLWDRQPETKAIPSRVLSPSEMRPVVAASKVCLLLVRRANRDGHAMRTFELPAMGACILAEDTAEHRLLLGDDLERVRYFRELSELGPKLALLLGDQELRARLRSAAQVLVTTGGHTYADRLREVLRLV